jgi:uncharacterized membrane protein
MSFDLSPFDWAALLWFLLAWLGYDFATTRLFPHRNAIHLGMHRVRLEWMRELLRREMRMPDAMLVGHTVNSISFFASTTMLVIAGMIGVLGSIDRAFGVISGLRYAAPMSESLFEFKVLALLVVFAVAFFRFTWALRQFSYYGALIGAAPPAADRRRHAVAARELEALLGHAIASYNSGLQGYYFAIALLAWFLGPVWFMLATLGVIVVLYLHHYRSPAARLIASHMRGNAPRPRRGAAKH